MSSSLDCLDLCRLCLIKDRVSVPIFEDEGDVRQIFLKITACLPVKVSRDDKLPKKICDDCVYKVELFYQFWNTTANAEKQLLQWLGEVDLEDKQTYVTEVLDTNVMKQEQNSDNRLEGNVIQVSGHQNNMDIGMIEDMTIMTIPAGSEQQFTTVPMDTSGTVQTVQAVPGPSTHDQMGQSQTHLVTEEVEESEEEENSDDGCDNEEGLPVKEETEEVQTETFVNVPISCDEAGPSGLQQQKVTEMSEMSMTQTATDGDPKTGNQSMESVANYISVKSEDVLYATKSADGSIIQILEDEPTLQSSAYSNYIIMNGDMDLQKVVEYNTEDSTQDLQKVEEYNTTDNSQDVKKVEEYNTTDNLQDIEKVEGYNTIDNSKDLEKVEEYNTKDNLQDLQKVLEYDTIEPPDQTTRRALEREEKYCPRSSTTVKYEKLTIKTVNNVNKVKMKVDNFYDYSLNNTDTDLRMVMGNNDDSEVEVEIEDFDPVDDETYDVKDETNTETDMLDKNNEDIRYETNTTNDNLDEDFVDNETNDCRYETNTADDNLDEDFVDNETNDCRYETNTANDNLDENFVDNETNDCRYETNTANDNLNENFVDSETNDCRYETSPANDNLDENFIDDETNDFQYESNIDDPLGNCEDNKTKKIIKKATKRKAPKDKDKDWEKPKKQKKTYPCTECDKSFPDNQHLQLHMYKHVEMKPFKCDQCPNSKSYKSINHLNWHIKYIHSNDVKFYNCSVCDFKTKSRSNIKHHFNAKHTEGYSFECPICNKPIKTKRAYNKHVKTHSEPPCVCNYCGKIYPNMGCLSSHITHMHETKPKNFVCNICNKKLRTQKNLDSHLKLHEINYTCKICYKEFKCQDYLTQHMYRHQNAKACKCPICDEPYASKVNLRFHLLKHLGERPYHCDICGKDFSQRPGLMSHRKARHPEAAGIPPPVKIYDLVENAKDKIASLRDYVKQKSLQNGVYINDNGNIDMNNDENDDENNDYMNNVENNDYSNDQENEYYHGIQNIDVECVEVENIDVQCIEVEHIDIENQDYYNNVVQIIDVQSHDYNDNES